MDDRLQESFIFEFSYRVPEDKTVPHLYPESPEFQEMPEVFATGYMVGLFEWACVRAIKPYLDWPTEQTVGIHVNVSHIAATPPDLTVTVKGRLDRIDNRKLSFTLKADDGIDVISEGTHDRFIIYPAKFNEKMLEKVRKKE